MRRISVVGVSGSGKSTVAAELGRRLGYPVLELDSLFHQPGWTRLPKEDFQHQVAEFITRPNWVVDGNYSSQGITEMVWSKADTIIWLDLPRLITTWRAGVRTLRRGIRDIELWNGNKEKTLALLDPRPSKNMAVWSWARSKPTQRKYEQLLTAGAWNQPTVYRLENPTQVNRFLEDLSSPGQFE